MKTSRNWGIKYGFNHSNKKEVHNGYIEKFSQD